MSHILQHRVIAFQFGIIIRIRLHIMAAGGSTVIAQPIQEELAKDDDQRELAKASRNAAAHALILEQILIPRQVQILIEVGTQHALQLHEIYTSKKVERHGKE